jgi:hypothetical protein
MPRQNLSLLASLNPHQDDGLQESQLPSFSLNVIYQSHPSKSRAKTNCGGIEIPLIVAHPSSTSQPDHSSGQTFFSKQDQEMALVKETKQILSRDQFKMVQSFHFLSLPF